MAAYYNDNDPKVCAWLRELILEGLIVPGEVDDRPIQEIKPDDLKNFVQCHFFAGIGGWSRALRLARWSDDEPVWTCSCPCQPFSDAGQGRGTDDERHLWPIFFRLVEARGPGTIFGEQVASAAVVGSSAKPSKRRAAQPPESVWLDGVFADLESAHYACGASDLPATCVGAPHIRQRAFWVAYAGRERNKSHRQRGNASCESGETEGIEEERQRRGTAVADCGTTGGMAEPDGRQLSNGDAQRGGEHRQQPQNGCYGSGMDNATGNGAGCTDETEPRGNGENHGLSGATGSSGGERVGNTKSGRCGEQRDAAQPGSGGHSIGASWAGFDILPCRDGKARRVESGTFPLAHGIPGRVGLLRGYGNAIVPEVAAEFIQASEEARQGLHQGRLLTLADF